MFTQYPEIETEDGSIVCSLPFGKFKDIQFTLGKVAIREENDTLRVSFEYHLRNRWAIILPWTRRKFVKAIGDCLIEEIQQRILNEDEIIFAGGEGMVTYE